MSFLGKLARNVAGALKARGSADAVGALLDGAEQADARGEHAEAERLSREALALAPGSAAAWLSLGLALQLQRRDADASAAFERAAALAPGSAVAHYNLGRLHRAHGRNAEAAVSLARAVHAAPSFVDARIVLADALEAGGDMPAALRELRAALDVDAAHAGALRNYSLLLYRTGDIDEALRSHRRALQAAPDSADAALGVVLALTEIGRIEEAIALARRTLDAHPASQRARVVALFTLLFSDKLGARELFAEHRRVAALFEAEAPARVLPHANVPEPDKRLRVGYLSGDLHAHTCSLLLEHVLEHHDPDAVAPIAYSLSSKADAYTERMRPRFDLWRDVQDLDDAALAARIEADGVDILVDLAGYTTASRMGAFARRPAPVQVTWFAYISTSGLTSMTHRLTDTVLDPPGAEPFNTETLQRLPRSLWSYRPPHEARIEVSDAGHGERPVCFGSFNRYAKASETTLGLWIAALHAAPGSTLTMLTVPRGAAQRDLLERFEAAGIDRARVRLLPRLTQSEYYAAYREVDVCFDTTPYSGGFTVCDALWMGVPVVTLRGETSVSRSGSSILASAGFGEWIADGADAYVRIAAGLARQGRADGARRAAIRERFRASALMDEAGYTRDLERAYRAMWKAWCAARTAASLR